MSLATFTERLIASGLVHPLAVDDWAGYDNGATLERIYRLWEALK